MSGDETYNTHLLLRRLVGKKSVPKSVCYPRYAAFSPTPLPFSSISEVAATGRYLIVLSIVQMELPYPSSYPSHDTRRGESVASVRHLSPLLHRTAIGMPSAVRERWLPVSSRLLLSSYRLSVVMDSGWCCTRPLYLLETR
jgi:hypothetical protein